MRKLVTIGVLALALGSLAFAHGGAGHVMGTVKAVTSDSITVVTKEKIEKVVGFDTSTKVIKSGIAATAKDLKAGDRVVVDVHEMSGKLHAAEVRFGKSPSAATTADPHSH